MIIIVTCVSVIIGGVIDPGDAFASIHYVIGMTTSGALWMYRGMCSGRKVEKVSNPTSNTQKKNLSTGVVDFYGFDRVIRKSTHYATKENYPIHFSILFLESMKLCKMGWHRFTEHCMKCDTPPPGWLFCLLMGAWSYPTTFHKPGCVAATEDEWTVLVLAFKYL